MSFTRVDYIAQQLRALAPSADWAMQGIDRAQELARILDRADVVELSQLQLIPVTVVTDYPDQTIETQSDSKFIPAHTVSEQGYAFRYGQRQIGFLGMPERADNVQAFEKTDYGFIIAWSAAGHGHVGYVVRPNASGRAVEIAPVWRSSSDAGDIRSAVMSFASFLLFAALPIAGISAGGSLGAAILGPSVSASYPLLASAIGNAALSTVFNGGDVKSAVKNAAMGVVSGGIGSQVGSTVAQLAESGALGAIASSATQALISGGDVRQAVAFSIAREGAGPMFDYLNNSDQAPPMDQLPDAPATFDLPSGDVFGDPLQQPAPLFNDSGDLVRPWWQMGSVDTFGVDLFGMQQDGGRIPDASGFTPPAAATSTTPQTGSAQQRLPPPNSPVFDATNVVKSVNAALMAAFQTVAAFRRLQNPAVQTTARAVRPNGAVSVIGPNGLIQTRSPNGQVSATRPPVGIPQATIDGNYVVNNGDGTYTLIAPTGQAETHPYTDAHGSSAPLLLLGAAALFAFAQ